MLFLISEKYMWIRMSCTVPLQLQDAVSFWSDWSYTASDQICMSEHETRNCILLRD